MPQRFYPAVLERGDHGAVGVWFPDFPGCVTAARTQEEAMARAADALEEAMRGCAERDERLPEPTPLQAIEAPSGSEMIGIVAVGATPPDPSERVNVYLPKSLIERIDRLVADLGVNRSSFFGMAASQLLAHHAGRFGTYGPTGMISLAARAAGEAALALDRELLPPAPKGRRAKKKGGAS